MKQTVQLKYILRIVGVVILVLLPLSNVKAEEYRSFKKETFISGLDQETLKNLAKFAKDMETSTAFDAWIDWQQALQRPIDFLKDGGFRFEKIWEYKERDRQVEHLGVLSDQALKKYLVELKKLNPDLVPHLVQREEEYKHKKSHSQNQASTKPLAPSKGNGKLATK